MEIDNMKNQKEQLIVQNVSHSFGFSDILKDISFTLEKGKVISIKNTLKPPLKVSFLAFFVYMLLDNN